MRALPLVLIASLVACSGDSTTDQGDDIVVDVGSDADASMFSGTEESLGPWQHPTVDILWVVDNSSEMAEEQAAFAENIPAFIEPLVEANVVFQLAVTTTDLADAGRLRTGPGNVLDATPECAAASDGLNCADSVGPVLDAGDYWSNENQFVDDFACLAHVGTCGSELEQGLGALSLALSDDRLAESPDFIREDAALIVGFVTTEDDCTQQTTEAFTEDSDCYLASRRGELTAVADIVAQLRALKEDEPILALGVVGPPDGLPLTDDTEPVFSCISLLDETGRARDGERYHEFLASFSDAETAISVCEREYETPLRLLGELATSFSRLICADTELPTCRGDADCPADETCVGPFFSTEGPSFCSGVEVELAADNGFGFEDIAGPGTIGEVAQCAPSCSNCEDQLCQSSAFAQDARFFLRLGECDSRIGFSFTELAAQPDLGAELRLRVPDQE